LLDNCAKLAHEQFGMICAMPVRRDALLPVFAVLLAVVHALPAQDLQPRLTEIDTFIAETFGRQHIGGLTVGVVWGKELIWTKSYGDADMEKKVRADRDTVYRIGSVTKMFTGIMLRQLADAGKVHLEDPVEKYFPEINLVQGSAENTPPITLYQLATHTAGLPAEPDDTDTYVTGPYADWEKTLIAALPHTHYTLPPGTRFSYSNIGYAILGAALGRAGGEAYLDYVPKHILKPLRMSHSGLYLDSGMQPHLAKGYEVTRTGIDPDIPLREHQGRGYKMPNGAMYTTVGDLARFTSFFIGEGPETVLKTASLERSLATSAERDLSAGYGIGFETRRLGSLVWIGHSGAVAGYSAGLYTNRQKKLAVIVLANTVGKAPLALRSLDILCK
jgi:CubicO group peptidase (beta-lactamase class C family)